MGKEKKKTHSKFHRDHTIVSWNKIGGTNFGSSIQRGEGGDILDILEFLENSKKDEKKMHNNFHIYSLLEARNISSAWFLNKYLLVKMAVYIYIYIYIEREVYTHSWRRGISPAPGSSGDISS